VGGKEVAQNHDVTSGLYEDLSIRTTTAFERKREIKFSLFYLKLLQTFQQAAHRSALHADFFTPQNFCHSRDAGFEMPAIGAEMNPHQNPGQVA
jgi:hypothetical protein